jgi:hypothetical protein
MTDQRYTERGFQFTEIAVADYPGEEPRSLQVQESSLASERKVWLGQADGPGHGEPGRRFHLNEEEARQVRDALSRFLGDESSAIARPHFCTPGCTEGNCPVDPLTDAEVAELRSVLATRSMGAAAAIPKQ